MDIRPIKTEADYEWAINEIEQYFDKEPADGTTEAARFDILTTLISAYEQEHYPVGDPEPIAYLTAVMEFSGRTRSDLAKVIGSRPRASDILARRQALTLEDIRKLVDAWGLSAEVLAQPFRPTLAGR